MMGTPLHELSRDTDEIQHHVTLTRSFLMMSTEVTQQEFQALMGYNPSENRTCGGSCPVENVNWHEAAAYANAMSQRERRQQCYICNGAGASVFCNPIGSPYSCTGYRLPTESEWEYAARAGTASATYFGDVAAHLQTCEMPNPTLDPISWFCGNSGRHTHRVGTRAPNAFGLYDVLGNVYEWCHDWFGDYPHGRAVDPWGPVGGTERAVRGGSFCCTHNRDVRCGERMSENPTSTRHSAMGIRLVRLQ